MVQGKKREMYATLLTYFKEVGDIGTLESLLNSILCNILPYSSLSCVTIICHSMTDLHECLYPCRPGPVPRGYF